MGQVADYVADRKKKNPKLRLGSLHEIASSQVYPPLSTDNIVMDYITSIGGFPRGLVTEVRGEFSSGKTTICAQAAAAHQQAVIRGEAEGAILYLDFEYAVSESYFANLGLDVNDEETFVYFQPDTLEEGFNMFLDMTKAGLLAMCIVDSVAGASAEAEYENNIGKLSIGQKAKALHQSLRMSVGPMRVHGTGLVLINHIQDVIPQTFGEKQMALRGIKQKVSPGGKAIEYYTSMRVSLDKPSQNKEETLDDLTQEKSKLVTSTEVTVTCFKNKVGVPHRTGKMRVHFGKGFSQAYAAFNILVDHGIVKKKSGGHFDIPEILLPPNGDKVPVGMNNIVEAVENNPEWESALVDAAKALVLKVQVDPTDVDLVITDVEFSEDDANLIEQEDGTFVNVVTGEVVESVKS